MKTGKIVEVGTHQTLISEYPDGIYSQFVREQELSEANKDTPDDKDQDSDEGPSN